MTPLLRHALLLAAAALVLGGCDLLEAEFRDTAAEIKKEKGIDVTNPVQVAGASMFADDDEKEQLDAAKSVQRLINEQKGDDELARGNPTAARERYERALEWTRSDDRRNSRAIKEKIADTWIEQAGRFGDDATVRGLRSASRSLAQLASDEKDPRTKARLLAKQAVAEWNLDPRDTTRACEIRAEALRLDPRNEIAFHMSGTRSWAVRPCR